MIPLLPDPPQKIRKPLQDVVERVVTEGGQVPSWIAVEDKHGQWLYEVSRRPACERCQAVLAATSEAGLLQAARLGVAGAVWLPPSTAAMTDAFTATSREGATCWEYEPRLGETVGRLDERSWVVTWQSLRFWRRQLGEHALGALLGELAGALKAASAILPWPALVLSGLEEETIRAAAEQLRAESEISSMPEIEVIHLGTPQIAADGVIVAASRAAVSAEQATSPLPELEPVPVCELPSGNLIGWWTTRSRPVPSGNGWLAEPVEATINGFRWCLRSAAGVEQWVEDLATVEQLSRRAAPAIRVPGWLALAISSGSPAGLLAGQMAERAHNAGVALWVTNVNQELLRFLMRLQVPLWVDGPAVPVPARSL
jgi:transposase-like protein